MFFVLAKKTDKEIMCKVGNVYLGISEAHFPQSVMSLATKFIQRSGNLSSQNHVTFTKAFLVLLE